MRILQHGQIKQKIKRLAVEIIEQNFEANEIILAGINNNGHGFAQLILKEAKKISDKELSLCRVDLNPAKPLSEAVEVSRPIKETKNKVVILVDDVANTGRTIFYACKPFMDELVKKLQVAVLVDRKHKSFPIHVDYVGLSLATTLKDNIAVDLSDKKDLVVSLD